MFERSTPASSTDWPEQVASTAPAAVTRELWAMFPGSDDDELFGLTLAAYGVEATGEARMLPEDFEEVVPGPYLATILAGIDRSRLSGHDLVRLMQARSRMVAHLTAGLYADISEVAHADDAEAATRSPYPVESAVEEIQTALRQTRRAAEADLDLALDLSTRMPRVWDALNLGRIDRARARVFATELSTLHPALVPEVVDKVIRDAPDLTTGQLRARLQRAVIDADPEAAEHKLQAGIEDRKMILEPNPDHTANLRFANIDPAQAIVAARYINGLAMRQKKILGETRTLDQLRADIAIDLLQGKTTGALTPIQTPIVVIDGGSTGHVPGFGSVLPSTAASLVAGQDSEADHGDAAELCGHQTPSRRPTPAQVRHITRRYPTCIFPGCRTPSTQCDLDHRQPWSKGGPTACHNLAPLCRHHHRCKPSWRLVREVDGSHTWTSPLGHSYNVPGRPP